MGYANASQLKSIFSDMAAKTKVAISNLVDKTTFNNTLNANYYNKAQVNELINNSGGGGGNDWVEYEPGMYPLTYAYSSSGSNADWSSYGPIQYPKNVEFIIKNGSIQNCGFYWRFPTIYTSLNNMLTDKNLYGFLSNHSAPQNVKIKVLPDSSNRNIYYKFNNPSANDVLLTRNIIIDLQSFDFNSQLNILFSITPLTNTSGGVINYYIDSCANYLNFQFIYDRQKLYNHNSWFNIAFVFDYSTYTNSIFTLNNMKLTIPVLCDSTTEPVRNYNFAFRLNKNMYSANKVFINDIHINYDLMISKNALESGNSLSHNSTYNCVIPNNSGGGLNASYNIDNSSLIFPFVNTNYNDYITGLYCSHSLLYDQRNTNNTLNLNIANCVTSSGIAYHTDMLKLITFSYMPRLYINVNIDNSVWFGYFNAAYSLGNTSALVIYNCTNLNVSNANLYLAWPTFLSNNNFIYSKFRGFVTSFYGSNSYTNNADGKVNMHNVHLYYTSRNTAEQSTTTMFRHLVQATNISTDYYDSTVAYNSTYNIYVHYMGNAINGISDTFNLYNMFRNDPLCANYQAELAPVDPIDV